MKKVLTAVLVMFGFVSLILAPVVSAEEPVAESVFKLTDGYFQVRVSQPSHFICQPIEKQYAWLDDEFRLWMSWKIEDGKESPCSRRSDNSCFLKLEIIGKKFESGEEKTWEIWSSKEKIDKDISWAIGGAKLPKTVALGDAKIRISITDKEKTYYFFEILIEIK